MISCLIVEDEPLAADILQDYISQLPFLELKATCTDAIYALDVLKKEKIDLIFLDIHLPGLKGLEFLKTLAEPPKVILTTAYHEYALESYELNVVDYLLKPIEFTRFLHAVNKVSGYSSLSPKNTETLTIHSDKKKVIIAVPDIIYIESQKEYIKIQTVTESYTTKYALTKIEEEIDPNLFIRVHRSFIISIKKIKAFNAHEIELTGRSIPIGGNYKESVMKRLNSIYLT
jgi:DNA-binding LytR/AlgR family response regulator